MHTNVKLDKNINCAILTVSDTRNYDTDKGGKLAISLLSELNVHISDNHYRIVKDDIAAIQTQLKQ